MALFPMFPKAAFLKGVDQQSLAGAGPAQKIHRRSLGSFMVKKLRSGDEVDNIRDPVSFFSQKYIRFLVIVDKVRIFIWFSVVY